MWLKSDARFGISTTKLVTEKVVVTRNCLFHHIAQNRSSSSSSSHRNNIGELFFGRQRSKSNFWKNLFLRMCSYTSVVLKNHLIEVFLWKNV
jgi:hypothetical protein